jgi:hypothetical protein
MRFEINLGEATVLLSCMEDAGRTPNRKGLRFSMWDVLNNRHAMRNIIAESVCIDVYRTVNPYVIYSLGTLKIRNEL